MNFTDHITKTAQSCIFASYNIKKIRPFLSEHATQLLVQALVLSRLDYCHALLAGLTANSIKPLKLIQNAAARLIFNEPKTMHVTPLFINLHWLPIAARIKFKALMFAYRNTSGTAPLYLNSLRQTYVRSRSLHSASEQRITVPSQRGTKSLSQTFSLTVPIWWNDLPNSIRAAESLAIFKKRLKHISSIFIRPSNSSTLYSNLILSNQSSFYKKNTHLTLYQLHIYSLTASFSCKTNTRFLFSIFYILVFLKKKPSYVYCVRLTRTCNSTCMLLLFCWFWLLL